MLKWLVTGRDREGTSATIFEDTLDEIKVEENDHYNKIYCFNRVNPLFGDDDPHIRSPSSQGLGKNCDIYRISSCSSGYGSSISQDKSENISQSFISREDKAHTKQKPDTGNLLIPPPIWPGLRRIHSWLHFDELNEQDTKQLAVAPEDEIQEEENARGNNDYPEESDSPSEFDKTSLVGRQKRKRSHFVNSRGMHSVDKQRDKSQKRHDLRNPYLKHAISLPKHKHTKIRRDSKGISDKKINKKRIHKTAREQTSGFPKYMGTVELSAHDLIDPLQYSASHPRHYLQQFQHSRLLPSRDAMESYLYPWTHLDPGHGVWVEEKWRHRASPTHGYLDESEEKEQKEQITSYMLKFCKSFCFLLLLTTFVMVIVTVSVFLSREAR